MSNQLSILFYGKTSKITASGLLPIYLRVTINGKRFEVTTGRYLEPSRWSAATGRAKGNSEEARSLNAYLDTLRSKVYACQKTILSDGLPVNIYTFREEWIGKEKEPVKMLIEIFEEHNRQFKELVGKVYAEKTYAKFYTTVLALKAFIQSKYNRQDFPIEQLSHQFISDFAFYLKSERKLKHNSCNDYIKKLKKVVRSCVANGWLQRDPFFAYKIKNKETRPVFLTAAELQAIQEKQFSSERLCHVKDIFLFCCYTGLAYCDVKKLKRSELIQGVDGELWVSTDRQKTGTHSHIPILPAALNIISRYQDHPQCINDGRVLPVHSNQKMNSYLKEIADVCGITKPLSFHCARHTFATTVTLCNGVPIETVSRMLGHTNIKTTQHYARILDLKVSKDMQVLKQKFAG